MNKETVRLNLIIFACLAELARSYSPLTSTAISPVFDPTNENTVYTDIMSGKAPTTNKFSGIPKDVPYNSNIRPSGTVGVHSNVDSSGALFVNVEMDLKQIVSLDEVGQILTTNFYLQVSWGDPRLSWNSTSYNNVQCITALSSKVAIFLLYNNKNKKQTNI
jgi:hypothetical protein